MFIGIEMEFLYFVFFLFGEGENCNCIVNPKVQIFWLGLVNFTASTPHTAFSGEAQSILAMSYIVYLSWGRHTMKKASAKM